MALTLRGNGHIASDNYTIDSDGDITNRHASVGGNATVSGTLGVSGKATITAAGGASSPTLHVSNTQGTNSFNHAIEALAPTLGAGNTNLILMGKEPNNFNSAWVGHEWNSNASTTDNYLTFGHWGANHLWTMNGAGHIQTVNGPAFLARATITQTLGTSWQDVGYDTLSGPQRGGTNYNTTTSKFTAPVSGWYQFNASWTATTNADTDGTFFLSVNNSTTVTAGSVSIPTTSPHYDGHVISGCCYLAANDTMHVKRYSTVSTTTRGSNPYGGWFSGFLIG